MHLVEFVCEARTFYCLQQELNIYNPRFAPLDATEKRKYLISNGNQTAIHGTLVLTQSPY